MLCYRVVANVGGTVLINLVVCIMFRISITRSLFVTGLCSVRVFLHD
jgi:hypothetical protein